MQSYNKTISETLVLQQKTYPDKLALIDDIRSISYSILLSRVNQVSNWLQDHNITGGDIIALIIDPSIESIIYTISIINLGAIYLPIDPSTPLSRIETILNDAEPKLIIFEKSVKLSAKFANNSWKLSVLQSTIDNLSNQFIANKQNINHPCCIYYTSGSTGKPKGVLISQKAIINLAHASDPNENNIQVVAQFNNLNFDPTLLEIWGTLLNGASLFIVSNSVKQNPQQLGYFLTKHKVELIVVPTAYLHQVINTNPEIFDRLKIIHFGGEQVNSTLLNSFIEYRKRVNQPIKLINNYGPTEATAVTCRKVIEMSMQNDKEQLSSIGKPIPNVKIYLLDKDFQPVTMGNVAELYISGFNLALGYYKSPKLNKEKFISNPFSTDNGYEKLYKTGDLVEQLPNGELLYIGRTDDQIKVNGFRVHLSEIETQILQFKNIASAVVINELSYTGSNFLKAYIVPYNLSSKLSSEEIRSFLAKRLPLYMVPAAFIQVEQLPLNNIGKVDKKKLLNIPQIDLDNDIANINKYNTIEKLQKIFQKILNRKNLDLYKNFFDFGVTSILITEACFKINQALSISLKIADLIANPSINKLANYIDKVHVNTTFNNSGTIPLDIAVIGFSCRFPQSESWSAFWNNICNGHECITNFGNEISKEISIKFGNNKFIPAKGVINNIAEFDANFFGFNPADAKALDPQQRIMLECAWEALEMSGNIANGHKRISVFAGMADSSYLQENLLKNSAYQMQNDWFSTRVSTSMGALSTQISYCLNLKGKSLNINTACSTGLVAIEQACQDLTLGNSYIALAGGISIDVHHRNGYFYQENGIESIDGKCKPFSSDASGTVFSDGAGLVVLKRLTDAVNDNDTIYAVIRGCGINNDGSDKLGFTAPSIKGQTDCIKAAINQAQISANQIGFIETHGTATILGDIIEFSALNDAHRSYTQENTYCALGSVKANIGHTDIAAGIAGFIKTVLCLYYKKIPPLLNFVKPNSKLNIENSPFYVNTTLLDWKSSETRYAGVSAFGIGGTNAHIILEEYIQKDTTKSNLNHYLFILSAKSASVLKKVTTQTIDYLNNLKLTDEKYLSNMAYTLQTGRSELQYRTIAVGKNIQEIIQSLSSNQIFSISDKYSKLVFMFSGQGSQYQNMGIELFDKIPDFARIVNQCNELIKPYLKCDILELIRNDKINLINETQYTQPALFMLEYSLANLLMHYGVIPDALIGHSIGEYTAACISGVLSLEDAINLVCTRGLLMAQAKSGSMLSIQCNLEDFKLITNGINVDLALYNTFNNCVASGAQSEIDKLRLRLDFGKKFEYQILKVSHPFHSSLLDETCKQFKNVFINIKLKKPKIPIVSNFTGNWLTDKEAINPNYWCNHLRHTVKFKNGIDLLLKENYTYFIEVGVGHTLSMFTKEIASSLKINNVICHTLPNNKKYTSDIHQFLNAIGSLWQAGFKIEWEKMYTDEIRRHIPLPTYPFQRQNYWIEADLDSNIANNKNLDSWFYQPHWTHKISYKMNKNINNLAKQHDWIIFKDTEGLGDLIIATLNQNRIRPTIIETGNEYKIIDKNHYIILHSRKDHYREIFANLTNHNRPIIILHMMSYAKYNTKILTKKEIDDILDKSFYSMLFLTQSYIEVFGAESKMKCGIITTGSQQVVGTEILNPVNASLTGVCRVIPQEHPALQLKLIDITNSEPKEAYFAQNLINYCTNEWNEPHPITAYRNGYQWDLAYSHIKLLDNVNRFKDNGVYLCSGGLGGITLTLCEVIARKIKNPVFILISRTEFPRQYEWNLILENRNQIKLHQQIKSLQLLLSLGAILHIEQADIADINAITNILKITINLYGHLNGIIHAAGVPGGGVTQLKTKEDASKIFAPKLYGIYNLASATKTYHLDFVMLCSSVSALVSEAGQIDYCGANACLDTFAASNLINSNYTVAINWNTWESVGMAVKTARPEDVMSSDKANSITPEQGQYAFMKIMQNNYPQTAISSFEIDEYTNILKRQKQQNNQPEYIERFEQLNYVAPSNEIETQMAQIWQKILGINQIGITDDFFSLGGHSLKALKLIEKTNTLLGIKISLQDLYTAKTIANIVSLANKEVNKKTETILCLKSTPNATANIFMFHPIAGNALCYKHLVTNLNVPFSIFGLSDPSMYENELKFATLNDIARYYIQQIQKIQPTGTYFLIGYSFGGTVAYEVAHILKQQQKQIGMLCMIDSWAIFSEIQHDEIKFKQLFRHYNPELSNLMVDLAWARMKLLISHIPTNTQQDILLFKASELLDEWQAIDDKYNGWKKYTKGTIDVYALNKNHETIIYQDSSIEIAKILQKKVNNKNHGTIIYKNSDAEMDKITKLLL